MSIQRRVKVISSETVYRGKWVLVRKNKIIKPDGTPAMHEIVERKDGVLIIAVQDQRLYLIEQYRYPVNERLLEFPVGFIEDGETPEKAAKRELEEETGLCAQNMEYLGYFWSWPGLLTSKTHVFYADRFKKGTGLLDATESDLKTVIVPIKNIKTLLKEDRIRSSATQAAFNFLRVKKPEIFKNI